MNANRSAMALTYRYHSAATRLEPQITRTVMEMTGRVLDHLETHRGDLRVVLDEVQNLIRRELLDRLTSAEFLTALFPELSDLSHDECDGWIRNCSYLVRRFAVELSIPDPPAGSTASVKTWAAGSIAGALTGVLIPVLLGVDPQVRFAVAAALSPIGALSGILSVKWLSEKSSFLHRLLNIRSQELVDKDVLAELTQKSIRSWLASHIVIILLTGRLIPASAGDKSQGPEPIPEGLLRAIQKLAEVPDSMKAKVAEEVIQEYVSAGYEATFSGGTVVWTDNLKQQYEAVGLIQEGDRCRILVSPIVQDGEIRRKGRLTRLR